MVLMMMRSSKKWSKWRFSRIRQVAPVCTPSNTWFVGPTESTSQTAFRSVQPFLNTS